MRSFKSRLAKKVAAHYADAVLANFHAKEPVSVDISTKTLRNVLPLWVADVVVEFSREESLFRSAWAHLSQAEAEFQLTLQTAQLHHNSGTLFRALRRNTAVNENPDSIGAVEEELVEEDPTDDGRNS
eukprot:4160564-Amphidinium_carterae.1